MKQNTIYKNTPSYLTSHVIKHNLYRTLQSANIINLEIPDFSQTSFLLTPPTSWKPSKLKFKFNKIYLKKK